RYDDERLARLTAGLASQHVEVLRCSRAIDHLHISLRAKLQEPLDSRARMLRPLSLVTVRQQQDNAARLVPLLFPGCYELVNYDLRGVDEAAKLRSPQHKCFRRGDAVAVFETERPRFRQRAVIYLKSRPAGSNRSQRRPFLARLRIGKRGVALAECPSH